jgi:cytochrome P450
MAMYEDLRARHGAVAPVLVQGDLPAWLVLGYRENLEVMKNSTVFSRDSRHWRDAEQGRVPADHPLTPMTAWQPLVVFLDEDEHKRLRGAVTRGLSQFERRGLRAHVTRYTHRLIDEFAGAGSADLVEQFSAQLPLLVMTKLFGMPDEGPRFRDAVRDVLQGTETAPASNQYITGALQELVARKRVTRGFDLPSLLMDDPAGLSDDEVREHLRLILTAANPTTVNLLANTLRVVLTDGRFRGALAGGQMTLPSGLEQVMWDDPPMMTLLGRWATKPTVLGEQRIQAGDLLLLGLAAGNADPAIREEGSSVLGNRAHLAFSGGPHECPGQDLARSIVEISIDDLLARLPDLRLEGKKEDLSWSSSLNYRALEKLPVTFTPTRRKFAPATVAAGAGAVPPVPPTPVATVPQAPVAGLTGASGRAPWWKPWARQG